MRSPNTVTISGNAYSTLLIFGALALAVFIFFADARVGSKPTTDEPAATPTEIAADLESYAQTISNNLGATAKDQIEQQLANLRNQLPSLEEFAQSQGVGDPGLPLPPGPIIEPISTALPPTPVPMPTPIPLPTLPPAVVAEQPTPVPPTPVPFDLASAPTYHVAILSDGRKHIMTSQRVYVACSDMFLEYGGVVGMQYGYPLYNWFMGLSREERTVYYYQCNR